MLAAAAGGSATQRQRLKVLGAGIFSLVLALGVARFAYTPLLPLMQSEAGLGIAEAGWLAATLLRMGVNRTPATSVAMFAPVNGPVGLIDP